MKDQLRLLIELQGYDARIQEIESSMRALPEKLAPAKADLAKLEALLQGEKDELARTEAWRKEQEIVLAQEQEAIKRAKSKVQDSKSAKDFNAATRELDNKRRSMSEREEETLKVMAAIETSRGSVADHEQDVDKLRQAIAGQEQEMQGRLAELAAELETARAERAQRAAGIDKQLLKRYDTVLLRRGVALVPVRDRACAGCHLDLPPQQVITIMRFESLETCPQCYRLLYAEQMLEDPADKPA